MEFNKEVRKVQLTGKTTYIVSLPKRWAESVGLSNGSLVTILRQPNNTLLIIPHLTTKLNNVEEATLIVSSKKDSESLKRMIISAYLSGYSIINIKSKDGILNLKQKSSIKEVVMRNLVGTAIIADSSNIMTLQVLTSSSELSIKTALRRMFLIALSMHRDSINALKDLNYELAESIINSDDEVDKFSLYIIRNLMVASTNEKNLRDLGLSRLSELIGYRVVVKSIERIADHATSIAEKIKELRIKPEDRIISKIEDMSNIVLSMFEDSIEALLRSDYELADRIFERYGLVKKIEDEINGMIYNNLERGTYRFILEDLRRVAEYSTDIAEIAINHTIDKIIIV